MRYRPLILLLFLISVTGRIFGQENTRLGSEEGPLTIAWQAVEGAAAYRVEIRKDDSVFIDTETDAVELRLDMSPGTYEYRISVVDPFGNRGASTAWLPLTVQRARTPYFRVIDPVTTWEGEETLELAIDVIGINDDLEFRLEKGDAARPLDYLKSGSGGTLTLSTAGLEPGEWNIRAAAPSGLDFVHPGALTIRPTRPPEISGLDNSSFLAEGLVPIAIDGVSFDEEMTVGFRGPGGNLEVVTVEVTDGGRAVAYVNLEGADAGSYDLIAANPAGDETILSKAITVEVPIEERPPKKQPRFEVQIGWAPMLFFIPQPNTHMFGLATFEAALTFHTGWTKPFVNGLGVEARFLGGASTTVSEWDGSTEFNSLFKADISGYWRPPVRGRAAPVMILGFGNTWSGYAAQFGLENMLHMRFGLGVDFSTFASLTRIGLNLDLGFTSDETVPMVSLMFRRGFRL